MQKRPCLVLLLCGALALAGNAAVAAPPGPAELNRSIETSRKTIADYERILGAYDVEMRALVGNDPASAKRREEIRIIKQYYVRENETLKTRINDDYRKIQEYRARGIQ